jgi:hypothetical protein
MTGHVLTSVHFEVEDRNEVIARIEPGETRSVRVAAEREMCWYWTGDISDGFISSIGFSDDDGHTLGPVGLILPRSGKAQFRVQPRGGTADRPANYDVVGVISSRLRPTDIWDAMRRGPGRPDGAPSSAPSSTDTTSAMGLDTPRLVDTVRLVSSRPSN